MLAYLLGLFKKVGVGGLFEKFRPWICECDFLALARDAFHSDALHSFSERLGFFRGCVVVSEFFTLQFYRFLWAFLRSRS